MTSARTVDARPVPDHARHLSRRHPGPGRDPAGAEPPRRPRRVRRHQGLPECAHHARRARRPTPSWPSTAPAPGPATTSSTSAAARARPPAGRRAGRARSPGSTRRRHARPRPPPVAARRPGPIEYVEGTAEALPGRRRRRHRAVVDRHRPPLAGRRGGRGRGPPRAGARRPAARRRAPRSSEGATGLASHGWTDAQAASFAAHLTRAGFTDIETEHCHAGRPMVVVTATRP